MLQFSSLSDVAKELNKRYQEYIETKVSESENFQKGEKSKIFLWIINDLFVKYGEYFGYQNISDFKSSLITVQKRFKKRISISNDSIKTTPTVIIRKNRTPKEGDGESFLDYQIMNLGLNQDSYY